MKTSIASRERENKKGRSPCSSDGTIPSVEAVFLLELIRSLLRREPSPPIPKRFDWRVFFGLANRHSLVLIMAEGLRRGGYSIPGEFREGWSRWNQAALGHVIRLNETREFLIELFEGNRVRFLPLKGSVSRDYYPAPEMRSMGDLDFLIHPDDFERSESLLTRSSFRRNRRGPHDVSYFAPNRVPLELHYRLLCSKPVSVRTAFVDLFRPESLWPRLKRRDGFSFFFEMTPDDFCLFDLVHLAGHFYANDRLLRLILDRQILRNRWGNFSPSVERVLVEYRLDRFAANIDRLADRWFGSGRFFPNDPPEIDDLAVFLLAPSSRKRSERRVMGSICAETRKKGNRLEKYRLIGKRLFPSPGQMANDYPGLRRFPFLLPFYWGKRLALRVVDPNQYRLFGTILTLSSKRLDDFDLFFNRIGLNSWKEGRDSLKLGKRAIFNETKRNKKTDDD